MLSRQSNSLVSENEKLQRLEMLKVYFVDYSDYSDEKLRSVLRETNWDTDKTMEILMEETYNRNKTENQKKLAATNQSYSQYMASQSR